MMLTIHISIALASLGAATLALVAPSTTKLYTVYGLTAATLGTGVYLVATTGSNLLHACLTGLVYTATVTALAIAAQHRLATA